MASQLPSVTSRHALIMSYRDQMYHSGSVRKPAAGRGVAIDVPKPVASDGTAFAGMAFSSAYKYRSLVRSNSELLRLEFDMGILCAGAFSAGMRKSDLLNARALVTNGKTPHTHKQTTITEFWYSDYSTLLDTHNQPISSTGGVGKRCLCLLLDSTESTAIWVMRTLLHVQNIPSAKGCYDAQVCTKHEEMLYNLPVDHVPEGWSFKQQRTVDAYEMETDYSEWVIKFSCVLRSDCDYCSPSYEGTIEWRLAPSDWPYGEDLAIRNFLYQRGAIGWSDLVCNLNAINGCSRQFGSSTVPDIIDECPQGNDEVLRVAERTIGATVLRDWIVTDITRSIWTRNLLGNPDSVFVIEDTGGLRAMFLISREIPMSMFLRSGVVLDLAARYPDLLQAKRFFSRFVENGPTILDGEITRDTEGRTNFLVTRLVLLDGTPMGAFPLEKVQTELEKIVAIFASVNAFPFTVLHKRFEPLKRIGRMLLRWVDASPRKTRLAHDRLFHVKGMLFTVKDGGTLYSWQPPDRPTILFSCVPVDTSGTKLNLVMKTSETTRYSAGLIELTPDKMDDIRRIRLDDEVIARVKNISRPQFASPIAECRFNRDSEKWEFVQFRTDVRVADTPDVLIRRLHAMICPLTHNQVFQDIIQLTSGLHPRRDEFENYDTSL